MPEISTPPKKLAGFAWTQGTPYEAICFDQGKHPVWDPKTIGPYLTFAKFREKGVETLYLVGDFETSTRIAEPTEFVRVCKSAGIEVRSKPKDPAGGISAIRPGEAFALSAVNPAISVISTEQNLCMAFRTTFHSCVHTQDVVFPASCRTLNVIDQAVHMLRTSHNARPRKATLQSLFNRKPSGFPLPDPPEREDLHDLLKSYAGQWLKDAQIVTECNGRRCLDMAVLIKGFADYYGFSLAGAYSFYPEGAAPISILPDSRAPEKHHLVLVFCPQPQ